ncbi:BCNT-domain-containing protein, partial [Coprinopsis marcescibilis]
SDSEDDEDYVPSKEEGKDSSDDESDKEQNKSKPPATEQKGEKDLKKVWEDFQSSISEPGPGSSAEAQSAKFVKVVKRYRFAGEEHEEIIQVPEGSEEAKKWPPYRGTTNDNPSPAVTMPQDPPAPAPASMPKRKPGPRKPKTTLAPLPASSKAKKITTLEKSAMDWKAHVESQQNTGIQEQLEANKKGGGYLEKVEFLKRVEERKDESFEAARSSKRRKV